MARVAVVVGIVLLVLANRSPGAEQIDARALSSTGAVKVLNSRNGQAILNATNMKPGSSASGTVTIANTGGSSGAFALEPTDLVNAAGPRGGRLAQRLRLEVRDLGSSEVVYSGSLTGLSSQDLGTWQAGETHTYAFDVTLTGFPAVGDDLQGATARVSFRWAAEGDAAPPTGGDTTPEPPPVTTTDSTPPPTGGGTGVTPPPPPPPADTTPPRLTLVPGKAQKLKQGSVKLKASCDEPCRIVSASARGSKVKAPAVFKAGASSTITVKLSKKDAKKLAATIKKRRKANLKLKITAADMAGNRATAPVKLKLKR